MLASVTDSDQLARVARVRTEALRRLKRQTGLTDTAFARKLGMSQQNVSRVMRGGTAGEAMYVAAREAFNLLDAYFWDGDEAHYEDYAPGGEKYERWERRRKHLTETLKPRIAEQRRAALARRENNEKAVNMFVELLDEPITEAEEAALRSVHWGGATPTIAALAGLWIGIRAQNRASQMTEEQEE